MILIIAHFNFFRLTPFFSVSDTVVLSDQEQGLCTNGLGDFNDDGLVNVLDIVLLVAAIVDGDGNNPTSCGELAVEISGK